MQATERKAESLLAEIAGALREAPDLDESFAAKLTPRSAIKLQPGGLPGGAGTSRLCLKFAFVVIFCPLRLCVRACV